MATYRRGAGRCQRWHPESGTWTVCPLDEPETRVRKPGEGLVVLPTRDFQAEGPALVDITDLIRSLRD